MHAAVALTRGRTRRRRSPPIGVAHAPSPWLNERPRWVIAWMLVVTLAPIGLEWLGVFQSTWSMIDGGVCATSAMLQGRSSIDASALVVVNLISIGAVAVYGININRRTADANHKLFVLAWHLGQLLPAGRVSVRSISPVGPRS